MRGLLRDDLWDKCELLWCLAEEMIVPHETMPDQTLRRIFLDLEGMRTGGSDFAIIIGNELY